uniref:YSIRK-targeted surface antigen transcriptional regulator n=1 Tax=Enterococcus sp. RIT-PI-f TaxID=1690244 RepID=UPI003562C5D4
MEDLLHDNLYEKISLISSEVELECVKNILSQSYDPEEYLFLYENKFEEYVATGDLKKLKDLFFKIGNGIIPTISGDTIRSEKNYSIIIFEKLTQAAINNGVDVAIAYKTRDNLIRKNELSVSLNEVQDIRDSCIIIFMEKINKVKLKKLSPLISSVIQYIGINIHKKITVKELAKYFSMSETMLRKTFKKEMHMTVYSYISKRKIDTAKIMLKTDYTISEVALALDFSDSAHFCKVFKKITGSSPKKYKQLLKK